MASALRSPAYTPNVDEKVVKGFGEEWSRFDQSALPDEDRQGMFDSYFGHFPWNRLPPSAVGFDFGCGSGRWAKLVAPRIGTLHCIDASSAALDVARRNLGSYSNCCFHLAGVEGIPLADNSADFGYSLGVLHHIPDTPAGLMACTRKLKTGAPFLLYLYYRFDNRPWWFRLLWKCSELGRLAISHSPTPIRHAMSELIAAGTYWPLARLALGFEKLGFCVDSFPLSYYRARAFYVMRTDALDRFGTRLEHRFTREEIRTMMTNCNLTDLVFSERAPYWCVVGIKK